MKEHEKINYVEFPAKDIKATKDFFTKVFNWSFVDYGPDYTAFSGQGLDGGFFRADMASSTKNGSASISRMTRRLPQLTNMTAISLRTLAALQIALQSLPTMQLYDT